MSASSLKPRIVVIDSHKLRRACLVRLIEDWAMRSGLKVTATSDSAELPVHPKCALVIINLGGNSVLGDEPLRWIRSVRMLMPEVPLVILSDREERNEICAAFRQGATGFIGTNLDPPLAMHALTFLLRGGFFFPPSALSDAPHAGAALPAPIEGTSIAPSGGHAERLELARDQPAGQPLLTGGTDVRQVRVRLLLTPRQLEVMQRLREGKPNKLIARDLNMTEATVKVHVRQIMRKCGAVNRTQAALSANLLEAAELEPAVLASRGHEGGTHLKRPV